MENQTIKLERFKQAVFEDAEKQAKLITESADKQRENELAQAKIEAQSLADSKKAAADKTEEARAIREISSKQLEAKRNVLCHREKLIDSVFDNVKSRLATFKASRDSIELGGMLMVYEDIGIALDYTFDSAFEGQRSAFTEKAELVLG